MGTPPTLKIGRALLDPETGHLTGPAGSVHLEPRVVDLAARLLENAGNLVTRDTLVDSVWQGWPGGDQSLTSAVSKLRKALVQVGDDARIIETVPKRGYRLRAGRPAAVAAQASRAQGIAVLPFANLGGEETDAYLCEGLAEDLLDGLGRIQGLRVAARTSSFSLARSGADLAEIGSRLNVDRVLEGSLRRIGNDYRVRVALAAVDDQAQLWSREFECPEYQLPDLHLTVLRCMVAEAGSLLAEGPLHVPLSRPTAMDPEAYNAFLRGRYLWYRENTNPGRALEQFRRAIELAPDFAAPYAGLVDCYCTYGVWQLMDQAEARSRALDCAEQAMALAPESADVWFSHGYAQFYARWRWDSAERSFRHALQIEPDHVLATSFLSVLTAVTGRAEESGQLADRLIEIDPLSCWAWTLRGAIYFGLRDYEPSSESALQALVLEPDDPFPLWVAGATLAYLGRVREAQPLVERLEAQFGHLDFLFSLAGAVHVTCGDHQRAEGILTELRHRDRERRTSPLALGQLNAVLGYRQEALDCLALAFKEHNMAFYWISWMPNLDSLREHPQFRAFLQDLGLPSLPDVL